MIEHRQADRPVENLLVGSISWVLAVTPREEKAEEKLSGRGNYSSTGIKDKDKSGERQIWKI